MDQLIAPKAGGYLEHAADTGDEERVKSEIKKLLYFSLHIILSENSSESEHVSLLCHWLVEPR